MTRTKGKFIAGGISYGDRLQLNWDEDLGLNTLDKADRMFRQWADNGVNRIQWRVGTHGDWSRYNHLYGETFLRLAQMAELKGLIIVPWTSRERIDQLKYSRKV
jgi:hypothetical protein